MGLGCEGGCYGLGLLDPGLDVQEGGSYVPPPPSSFQEFGSFSDGGGGGGGTNWGNVIAGLAQQWSTIGGRVVAPTVTYQRNADGSLSIAAPASSAAGASLLTGAVGSGSSTGLLLIGGLLVGGLVLIMALKK